MIHTFGADAKRIRHALSVAGFARAISGEESLPAETALVLAAGALLHDIGIHESERKYGSTAGKLQEKEGPPIARELLEGLGLTDGFVERVCYLVGHHHTYSAIDDVDFQILVEADFLVNIFEDGMDNAEVQSVGNRIFKTGAGLALLQRMYGFNPEVAPPNQEETS